MLRARLRPLLLTPFVVLAGCDRRDEPPTPPASIDSFPPRIETVGGLQARDTETQGLVADLLAASRESGRLTVSVRFRNAGTDTVAFAIPADGGHYPAVRLVAGGRRWLIAHEEDGDVAAPGSFERTLAPGQSMLWRARFVAPPREVTTFDLEMPGLRAPFTEVPISDPPAEPPAEEVEEGEPPQEP